METMDIRVIDQGFGRPQAKRSVDRHPLTLHGEVFTHGVGSHVPGEVRIRLNGAATRFVSAVGIDDETQGKGSAQISVVVDGKEMAKTGVLKANGDPEVLDVDLTGAKEMVIEMTEVGGIDYGHLDFGGAYLEVAANATEKPQIVAAPVEDPITLPRTDADGTLHVVGARVIGGTPGRPFVFKVPVAGGDAALYTAENLPTGLTIDPKTGVISRNIERGGRDGGDGRSRATEGWSKFCSASATGDRGWRAQVVADAADGVELVELFRTRGFAGQGAGGSGSIRVNRVGGTWLYVRQY